MTDRFAITLQDAELQRALDRAAAKLARGELLDRIGALMERRINLRFDLKRDPAGVPWPPLSPKTQRIYAKQDAGRRQGTLLERTGRMRASLGYNLLGGLVGESVEIGFGVPYAAYHETGTRTKAGRPKMPRRALLTADWQAGTLGAGDREAILALLARYLDDLIA